MDILNFIKNDKNARRIFGKREIVIIEKQLLGVQLKPSEKTRLSRDIRKKFEAIRLLAEFRDSFGLKHGQIIKKIVEEAKEAILGSKYFSKIKKIILYGSAAENKLTLLSDIDIAVEFDSISSKEAFKFRLETLKRTDERIDLKVYNALPYKIKKDINKNGRIVYEKKN